MRCKTIVFMLALSVVTWAQTAGSNPQSTPPEKAKCACCDKMASTDGQSCARHMAKTADGEPIASCCDDKNGKSCCPKNVKCMKDGKAACCSGENKDKTAAASCGSDCSKSCGKGCCSSKTEKASRSCCHDTLQG
jgi:hypothetical protein